MDETNLNQQKPLRRTSNKIKDIYDAYVKNDKTKNIPISDSENKDVKVDMDNISEAMSDDQV